MPKKKTETSTADTQQDRCAWQLDRLEIERLTGGQIDDEIVSFRPFGNRLVIVRRIASEKTSGGIIMPESVRDRDTLCSGTGYVFSVGDQVERPDLLGKQVIFEAYTGSALGKANKQGENIYESRCITLTESDLWGVVE